MSKRAPTPSSDLEIMVHTVGGVFGDDRITRVADQTMTVTNHGAVEARSELPDSANRVVTKLARRLAAVKMPEPTDSGYVPDGGTTTIEVNVGTAHRRIVLNAGDDAPQPVWDLLDELERIRREAD